MRLNKLKVRIDQKPFCTDSEKKHAQPCADDSLPDDEEIAPLSEIEQVKGEN